MVKEKEASKKEKEDAEKIRLQIEQMAESKKKQPAKEMVQLSHVETQKQEVSKETIDLARTLKSKIVEKELAEQLSNDEITILESFMGKRQFLSRIAIVANQSRMPMGKEPLKKADLEKILNDLSKKGYVASEKVQDNMVYFLTEKGKQHVQ